MNKLSYCIFWVNTENKAPQGRGKQTEIATTGIPSYGIYHNHVLKFGFATQRKEETSYTESQLEQALKVQG